MLETLLNGRYRILRVLGSGGFGKTFVAEDTHHPNNPACVIKQFKPTSQDEAFLRVARRLFDSETESLRRLGSHDQIPELIDNFEESGEFYLVLEYVEGKPLGQQLSETRRLDEAAVITLLRDILHVLEFVHGNQVIHRDIKPGNLICRDRDCKYVLIDFGAVKELQTQLNTELMQTGYTVGIGTYGYGSSEQLMGKPRYSSDLYALGMTAIHALTGMQPAQLPTHPDTGEVIWRDQALVSAELVAILSKMVRYHFSDRYQSATEVLYALDQPTELILEETQAPLSQADLRTAIIEDTVGVPGEQTQVIYKRDRRRTAALVVGLFSLAITGFVAGLRAVSSLQSFELAVYDRLVQAQPDPAVDPRLTIVSITDADIQSLQQFPIPDGVIAQLLQRVKAHQPRVIGLDLLRDIPLQPGRLQLLRQLQASNVVVITNLGNPPTLPPRGTAPEQVGFNDLALDPGDVVRRNLMFVNVNNRDYYSFSLRLALAYLNQEGIDFNQNDSDRELVRLGKANFKPLELNAGGYQNIDARGYQILLRYRSRNVARQVSLSDVLNGKVDPAWFKDRVVLIGTTAATAKDLFSTPYSTADADIPRMPGVLIHAQMVSQIMDAALTGKSLFWFWAEWVELVWIAGWAVLGGLIAWFIHHPLWLGLSGAGLIVGLLATCYGLFLAGGWVPFIAPAIAASLCGGIVVTYWAYVNQKLSNRGN